MAVVAVAILALLMTGVLSIDDQNIEPYDYLCENGIFSASNEISALGDNYTRYEWISNDGIYILSRSDYPGDWLTDRNYCFFGRNCFGTAFISNISLNDSVGSEEAYSEFIDWCDKIGFNPNQLMSALDESASSR